MDFKKFMTMTFINTILDTFVEKIGDVNKAHDSIGKPEFDSAYNLATRLDNYLLEKDSDLVTSKTVVLCNLTPHPSNVDETLIRFIMIGRSATREEAFDLHKTSSIEKKTIVLDLRCIDDSIIVAFLKHLKSIDQDYM